MKYFASQRVHLCTLAGRYTSRKAVIITPYSHALVSVMPKNIVDTVDITLVFCDLTLKRKARQEAKVGVLGEVQD